MKSSENNKKLKPVKIIGLLLLAGVCVILVIKFTSAGSVPAFSGNDITPAASADPSLQPKASPTIKIEVPQPSASVSFAPEPTYVIREVKTGERQPLLPLNEINRNKNYKKFGSMITEGMTPEDHDKAMSIEWKALDTPGSPEDMTVELSDTMDYKTMEKYILNLGKYEGVEVSVIGESERGRNIYMVKVDFENERERAADKPVIMMTGGVHAREFAGADYMVKFLNDTIKQAAEDPYTRALLENVTVVAVPLVNPDGREMIIDGRSADRKSNYNGVDLNRSMPSVNAGQLAKDVELYKDFSSRPGLDFFGGYNLGTESESQAMIKWFNYYVPRAYLYIDLHQMGGITYYGKGFVTRESDSLSREYAIANNDLLQGGYPLWEESLVYGFNGNGGTFTDYARSIAEGFTYSYALGRMVLAVDGAETPLICFHDLDDNMRYYTPVNENFRSICIEIGRKQNYLGAGKQARENRKTEYETFGWSRFLTGTIENVLGKEKADALRRQSS